MYEKEKHLFVVLYQFNNFLFFVTIIIVLILFYFFKIFNLTQITYTIIPLSYF